MVTPTPTVGERVAYVESDSKPGHFYQVTPTACSCEQFRFRLAGAGGRCKHMAGAFPPAPAPQGDCSVLGHDWQPLPGGTRPLPVGYAADRCGVCGAVRERRALQAEGDAFWERVRSRIAASADDDFAAEQARCEAVSEQVWAEFHR